MNGREERNDAFSSKIMETSGNRETAWRKYARGWAVRSALRVKGEMAKLTRGSGRKEWPRRTGNGLES